MGALINLGDRRGRDPRSAYVLYSSALKLDEDQATRPEAIRLYKRAVSLDPLLDIAHTNLGNCFFHDGDWKGAEACYKKALEVNPIQCEALYNLGYLRIKKDRYLEGIRLLKAAIESDPTFADSYFNLAFAYEEIGEFGLARENWSKYVELGDDETWVEIAKKHLR